MKNITEYINEYYFNKNLNENHYIINEGIMDWIRDFWDWLSGDDNKKEFNVWDDEYDEGEKKKYIRQFDSSSVKVQPAKDLKMIQDLIAKEKPGKDKKSIFAKTEDIIGKLGDDASNVKWLLFMFNSDDLKECAGILGYFEKSAIVDGAIEFVDIDVNKVYANVIGLTVVRDTIVKVAKGAKANAIVFRNLEKSVATQLVNDYSFELSEIKNNKGYYIHKL
jgi:hypothetical protein